MKQIGLFVLLMLFGICIVHGQYVANFEGNGEVKTAYASGNVNLGGISWNLNNVLIGTDSADWKNGIRSARLRGYSTSVMTMLADKPNGLGNLSFYYRRYSSDSQVDWCVEYSINSGNTWIQAGEVFTAPSTDVPQQFSCPINVSGNVRIRIKRATESGNSNNRLNIDDITLTDFTGLGLAVVQTAPIHSITANSAISGGEVLSDGGAVVTSRGVCYSTMPSPSLVHQYTVNGSGTGSFSSTITNLAAQTIFYVRAYATNSQGTSYGEEYSFSTSGNSPPASPLALPASGVSVSSFTANWNASIGASGYRIDVASNGSFSALIPGYNNYYCTSTNVQIGGLSASSTYYYRIRAVNAYGTSANSNAISVQTHQDDPYNGYYESVQGLSGLTLKNALHDLIDSNTYSSYDGAKTFLFQDLDNSYGVVRCVYTGRDYTINSTYNGGSDPNTEHTFAQSWFGSSEVSIKKADVHHLFITDATVNSSRGNLPFDVVVNANATFPTFNGYLSKRGSNSSGQLVFEPANQHKGNLARALLYFSVRYNMSLTSGGVDMLGRMIEWHYLDPVDDVERNRNDLVYIHQGNRNPFVDHPEYVSYIWQGGMALQAPIVSINLSGANIILQWNNVSGTNSYKIEASNNPNEGFEAIGYTGNTYYVQPAISRKFFRVIALD